MALFLTARCFIKQLLKSEIIMNKISQRNLPVINASDKYINELKSMNIKSEDLHASEFLKFPFKTFYKFPKITMESIITESFDILVRKGLVTADLYENLIDAYFKYSIDVNANDIKESMIQNGIPISEKIYSYFIRNFSLRDQMENTEEIVSEMISKGMKLSETDKFVMVTGYLIAGDEKKAEMLIINEKLGRNESRLSFAKCYAYAVNNDSTKVLAILEQNKQKSIKLHSTDYFHLYRQLMESNASQSALNAVIDFTKNDVTSSPGDLAGTVNRLNSADYFHQSIFLIYKFQSMVDDCVPFLESFTYSRCPLDTFRKALKILIKCDGNVRRETNIFCRLDIDNALKITQEFADDNWKLIYFSLINRAVDEKSPEVLQSVLEFCIKNAGWRYLNNTLFLAFFDSLKRNEMISNYEDVFDLIPRFKLVMLRVILMKYLCSGDFDRYNELRLKENAKEINVVFTWKFISKHIHTYMNLENVKQLLEEAHKCFNDLVVYNISSILFFDEVLRIVNSESFNELDQTIRWLREWNLQLAPADVKSILKIIPEKHREIVESSITKVINAVNEERTQRKE